MALDVAYKQPRPQGFSIFLGGKAPGTRLAYDYPRSDNVSSHNRCFVGFQAGEC